jgi:hypothetical protein
MSWADCDLSSLSARLVDGNITPFQRYKQTTGGITDPMIIHWRRP